MKLNTKKASEYLGCSVSMVYKLTRNKELIVHKMGRKNVYKITDLNDYFERNKQK